MADPIALSANYTFKKTLTKDSSSQNPFARLYIFAEVFEGSSPEVLVSLFKNNAGQTVIAAVNNDAEETMIKTGGGAVGYYIEKVDVQIKMNGFQCYDSVPQESNSSVSEMDSTNYSLNASVGMMGEMPTANVGGSIGQSYSKSQAYPNMLFRNKSTANRLHHEYTLGSTENGKYEGPSNLVKTNTWTGKGSLVKPSPMMTGDNLPIISLGVWRGPQGFQGAVNIDVTIETTFKYMHISNDFYFFVNEIEEEWYTETWKINKKLTAHIQGTKVPRSSGGNGNSSYEQQGEGMRTGPHGGGNDGPRR